MNLFFAQSFTPGVDLLLIAPEIIVCTAALVVMMVDAFGRPAQRWISGAISFAGLFGAAVSSVWLWSSWQGPTAGFTDMIVLDELRLGFTLVFLLVSGL